MRKETTAPAISATPTTPPTTPPAIAPVFELLPEDVLVLAAEGKAVKGTEVLIDVASREPVDWA